MLVCYFAKFVCGNLFRTEDITRSLLLTMNEYRNSVSMFVHALSMCLFTCAAKDFKSDWISRFWSVVNKFHSSVV